MKFEWDEAKNSLNKAKHGVSFEVAARVFADPRRMVRYDEGHRRCGRSRDDYRYGISCNFSGHIH